MHESPRRVAINPVVPDELSPETGEPKFPPEPVGFPHAPGSHTNTNFRPKEPSGPKTAEQFQIVEVSELHQKTPKSEMMN